MAQLISYRIDDRLHLSITDRCTLECTFCPKTRGCFRIRNYDLRMDYRPAATEIINAIHDPKRYEEVVFCGFGEPTLRLNVLLEVAHYVHTNHGKVRLITDGLANLVHKDDVFPLLSECVDALSVSMNAQNAEIYEHYCQPGLPGSYHSMLEFIKTAHTYIADVTATAIYGLDGVDTDACARQAEKLGVKFRKRLLGKVEEWT